MHVKRRSGALLSAICFAAARFFLPESADRLWNHSRSILGRAVINSECTLDLIQMICVMVYWKKPTEKSAWLDTGIAIRMAQKLGYHDDDSRRTTLKQNGQSAFLEQAVSADDSAMSDEVLDGSYR